ncbi:MAG: NAD-dependent epimerase/dehydratase family protein [Verrucomicrobiota bacterium]
MKVLVTGAAGFIGSHICDSLLALGDQVVGLDDLSGGAVLNVPLGVRFVNGSVTDHELLKRLFDEHQFDYVYHLAAYAAEGLSHFIRRFNYENNLIGSINLINQSVLHGVKCFVFASSIAVYGGNQLPMTEDLQPVPEDPYGISKYAVELDLKAAHEMFGLNYVIFRPHNVYGERQNMADKYRNVLGIFMSQIIRGEPMTIFGDGSQQRAFSYIGDVAPYMAEAAHRSSCYNQVFNVGASEATSVGNLAQMVASAMGAKPKVINLPERKEVKIAYADHSKLEKFFDVRNEMPLAEGLRLMAAWAKQCEPQKISEFGNIEVPINLPPSWK